MAEPNEDEKRRAQERYPSLDKDEDPLIRACERRAFAFGLADDRLTHTQQRDLEAMTLLRAHGSIVSLEAGASCRWRATRRTGPTWEWLTVERDDPAEALIAVLKDATPLRPSGQPAFEQAERVFTQSNEQGGRIQSVAYDAEARAFRYLVKWDNGPTTPHLEGELRPAPLPPHYP